MDKKVQRNFLWIALLALGTIWILARHNHMVPYQTTSGLIFGTIYNITYQYDGNLKDETKLSSNVSMVLYPLLTIRQPLPVSTVMKTSLPILSLSMYSVEVWRYPKKRTVLSI